jgi:hypothetical protein
VDLDLDLSQDPAALTAALVDVPSVSGDEERLANMIDAALRRIPHLELFRDGNAMVGQSGWCWPGTSTRCRSPATSRPASTAT